VKKWRTERNHLNLIVQEKWKQINFLKNKRNEQNQFIKKLKKDEASLLTQLDEKKATCAELLKRSNLSQFIPFQSDTKIHQQIKDIDWEIQTTPFSRMEEGELISQIRRLEEQLFLIRKTKQLKKEKEELLATIKQLSHQRKTIHRKKVACVKQSQKFHTKMLALTKEVDKVKAEADSAHHNVHKFNKEVTDIHNQYLGITKQITSITHQIEEIDKKSKQKDLTLMIEEQSKKAYEKMKQRKKLTLNEYILLKKKGLA
jgi:uncharacterized coiled-coil DUF342 family protein